MVLSDIFSTIQGTKDVRNIGEAVKKYPNSQKHIFSVNSNSDLKPIDLNKMFFLLIAAEIIDSNYEPKTDKTPPLVTLSLAKMRSLCPGTYLMDEGYWTSILTREPLMNYNE